AALLNVRRKRSAAESCSHLFRDRVIKTLEDFQFDGIASHDAQCNSRSAAADARVPITSGPNPASDSSRTRQGARAAHAEFCKDLQNFIDSLFTVPQYLG